MKPTPLRVGATHVHRLDALDIVELLAAKSLQMARTARGTRRRGNRAFSADAPGAGRPATCSPPPTATLAAN